jgi:uncharacterized membrane protein HdeD (DUF308 family)
MQFGRIQGIALMVLGIIVIAIQAMTIAPRAPAGAPTEAATKTAESKTSYVPGIVGAISIIAGVAVFATARHTDEPPPEDTVK